MKLVKRHFDGNLNGSSRNHGPVDYIVKTHKSTNKKIGSNIALCTYIKDINAKNIPIKFKRNKLVLDQTSEAYYGVEEPQPSAYTSVNKLKRNHSHNFDNSQQSKMQNKVDSFTNLATSLSYTNRITGDNDYNQCKDKTIDIPKSMSSERKLNRSQSKESSKRINNIKLSGSKKRNKKS